MSMIFSERVSILRAREVKGDYGGIEYSWDDPVVIPVEYPVSVQPTGSDEDITSRSQLVRETYRLFTSPPHLLEVTENDRLLVHPWGIVMEVVGRPAHWRGPLLTHSEILLEVLDGARRG